MTDFPSERYDRWKIHNPEVELEHPEDCGCAECDPDRVRDERLDDLIDEGWMR